MRKNSKQHSFAWQYEDKNTMHQTKELERDSQKKLTVPETSSERPLEHSEIANSKNILFLSFRCLYQNQKQSQPKTNEI